MYRNHWSHAGRPERSASPARPGNRRAATRRPRWLCQRDAAAARAFYCDALGGRQLWRARHCDVRPLQFLVAGTIIEVCPDLGSAVPHVVLTVDDPDLWAQRCWNSGFTVRVLDDETGRAPVSVIDPFGRRVDLVTRASSATVTNSGIEAHKEAS